MPRSSITRSALEDLLALRNVVLDNRFKWGARLEFFEQFSPEVKIKDPNSRKAAFLLPPITLFHGTSDYSIPSDARLEFLFA
ncbi:hypothetical protein REPUB_Repub04eG0194100 [Reevesia pubescens]